MPLTGREGRKQQEACLTQVVLVVAVLALALALLALVLVVEALLLVLVAFLQLAPTL